jgi:hypothetical protein
MQAAAAQSSIPDAEPPIAATMDKKEVCEYLGKSVRTVAGYMAKGELKSTLINGKAIFERADVERFKAELDRPIHRGVVVRGGLHGDTVQTMQPLAASPQAVAPHVPPIDETAKLQHFLADVFKAYPIARPKPWLTLAEAAEYSGLPASWLLAVARHGAHPETAIDKTLMDPTSCVVAINVGTGKNQFWRFNRAALEGRT